MSKLAIHGGDPVRTNHPGMAASHSELKDVIIATLENEGWGVGSEAISRLKDRFAVVS